MENLFIQLQSYLKETSPLAYLVVFLGGVLVSFTPCVYPLIPITVGYIGSHSQSKIPTKSGRSKLRGFILSLFYVLGVAVTYSVLGAFASFTGKLFGKISSSPLSYFIVANVCILLGLSLLEVFNLRLPLFPYSLQPKKKTEGLFAAFSIGLVSGLVVGPCTAPVLGIILVYVGTKQNILFGMTLLFTFAYGMGAVLILVGTSAAVLASLPKSGEWMVKVKKLFGFFLLGVGEYFLIKMGRLIVLLVCLGLGLSLGLNLLLPSGAIALGQKNDEINVGSLAPDFTLKDLDGREIGLSDFKGKDVVILVFWATWCGYCREEIPILSKIDGEYKNRGVRLLAINIREGENKLNSFVDRYNLSYTILLDSDGKMADLYGIVGIPTNIILDKQGTIKFKGHYIPKDYKKTLDELLRE